MKFSETKTEIFKAMHEFRKALKQPLKDANNPFFKSKYVPLENVVQVVDEAIKETGLSYSQEITSEGSTVSVATYIFHASGEYIEFDPFTLPATKVDAQGLGSATTYAKRYALSAAFGIASDVDDDGNSTSGKNAPKMADKTHLTIAKKKLEELAKQHEISLEVAISTVWKHTGLTTPFEKLSAEEMGTLLNYLNTKK